MTKQRKIVSFFLLCAVLASCLSVFSLIHAESVERDGTESANVIPAKIATFEAVAVGETPVNSGTYDKAEWGIFRPYTSDNNWSKAVFTADNYTVIPQIAEDPDPSSGHGHVLMLQPKAYNASPRWAIRNELYAQAQTTLGAVRYKIKLSVDIKKSDNFGAKLYFRKDSADTSGNLAASEVVTANGKWVTLTAEYTCTLEELQNNNNEFYYNIYLVQVQAPTGPMYLDHITATVTPVFLEEVTPTATATATASTAPTPTATATVSPTATTTAPATAAPTPTATNAPAEARRENLIPAKISDFEEIAPGMLPNEAYNGSGDKAEWGIFRPYTSDNNWSKAVFTADNYTVIPQIAEDPDPSSGHGHVLMLQPKAYNASPRWAIGRELYAEALKYSGEEDFIIKISADIKKSDNFGAKMYFRKDSADTSGNLAASEVLTANGKWVTLTAEYPCTLEELKNNSNEFYYNIYFVQVKAPTGPMYLDNIKVSLTPVSQQESPAPTEEADSVTGVIYEVSQDLNNAFLVSKSGIVGSSDVAGGKVEKSYTVYNIGKTELNIQMYLQVLHKNAAGENIGWYGGSQSSSDPVTIAPGKSATLTVSMPVNSDNTVTVTHTETANYPLSELFVRFDFKPTLFSGSKFVVACSAEEADFFLSYTATNQKTAWSAVPTTDKAYITGDSTKMLWIASAAFLTAVPVLIGIARKKKEQ